MNDVIKAIICIYECDKVNAYKIYACMDEHDKREVLDEYFNIETERNL